MRAPINLPLLIEMTPLTIGLIAGGGVLLVAVVVLLIFLIKGKKKGPSFSGNEWLIALGNKENIKEVTAIGSRLTLILLDKEAIDREKLKQLGVSSILVMSNKVTLVIEDKAEQIAASIQKSL